MKSLTSLKCSKFRRLCDRDLIEISNSLPLLEELDISYANSNCDDGRWHITDDAIEVLSRKLNNLQKIDFSGNCLISDRSLIALSSNCLFLREILFHNCCFVSPNGIGFALSNSANLVSVSMRSDLHPSLGRWSSPSFENSFMRAGALSSIEFSTVAISDACLCTIAKAHFPLKKLALPRCRNFTFLGISSILQAHPFLNELDLSGASFLTDQCIRDLSGYLSTLISINLTACAKLTNSTFFVLTRSCSSLKEIKMESTNLGEEGLVVGLGKNTRIRSLRLARNKHMNDKSLLEFASLCPNLQLLDVSSCSCITGGGIAEVLKSCHEVAHLEINFCGGVKSLGTDSKLCKLVVLKAASSGICDEGLIMVGQTCPWLLHLNLSCCPRVSSKGVKEIVRHCKGLREINMKGCLDLNANLVTWFVLSRPSLRKIMLPLAFVPSHKQRDFLLRHGCLVCDVKEKIPDCHFSESIGFSEGLQNY